jgi:hypothetical protein
VDSWIADLTADLAVGFVLVLTIGLVTALMAVLMAILVVFLCIFLAPGRSPTLKRFDLSSESLSEQLYSNNKKDDRKNDWERSAIFLF